MYPHATRECLGVSTYKLLSSFIVKSLPRKVVSRISILKGPKKLSFGTFHDSHQIKTHCSLCKDRILLSLVLQAFREKTIPNPFLPTLFTNTSFFSSANSAVEPDFVSLLRCYKQYRYLFRFYATMSEYKYNIDFSISILNVGDSAIQRKP